MSEKIEGTDNHFRPEVLAQFKRVKAEFSRSIAPKIRDGAYFLPNSIKKSRKQKRNRKNSGFNCFVNFPPLAAILSRGSSVLEMAAQIVTRTSVSNKSVTEKGKIISVFVILEFQMGNGISKYHLQKIQRKSRLGFPGGGIKPNENILEAGAREVREETAPNDKGIDISKYNPVELAKFPLRGAVNGERGIILYVKLPESEIIKLRPGGGEKGEDELVAHVYLATTDQVDNLAAKEEILPNSQVIWQIFKKLRFF